MNGRVLRGNIFTLNGRGNQKDKKTTKLYVSRFILITRLYSSETKTAPAHAMEMYGGSTGTAPFISKLETS